MDLGKKLLIGSALVSSLFLNNYVSPQVSPAQSKEFASQEKKGLGNIIGAVNWDPDKDGNYTRVSRAEVTLLEVFPGRRIGKLNIETVYAVRRRTRSASDGSFSFNGVAEGRYRVEAQKYLSGIPDFSFCLGYVSIAVKENETISAPTIGLSCGRYEQ